MDVEAEFDHLIGKVSTNQQNLVNVYGFKLWFGSNINPKLCFFFFFFHIEQEINNETSEESSTVEQSIIKSFYDLKGLNWLQDQFRKNTVQINNKQVTTLRF